MKKGVFILFTSVYYKVNAFRNLMLQKFNVMKLVVSKFWEGTK